MIHVLCIRTLRSATEPEVPVQVLRNGRDSRYDATTARNPFPGGEEIAIATSRLMEKYDAAIWAHHGIFCAGEGAHTTFGLMHTIEKSAEILVKVLSMSNGKRQTIEPDNFRELARAFKVELPERFLFEKKSHAITETEE